ncbi:MAG: hypothetical protein QOE63_1007 [Acidimicrobiaceae bacterium]|jgi:hypothetical protein
MSEHSRTIITLYRQATRLYPRRFREEDGPDLVLLFADQLRDEPTSRVSARGAVDLALTIPTRHVEAHMQRTPTAVVPAMFGALALSSLIVGLVVGHPMVLLLCTALAAASGGLGVRAARRGRRFRQASPATAHWWKVLGAGVALIASLVAVTTATGELPNGGWLAAMVTGLTAIVLMSAGILLGIGHLASRPGRGVTA